MKIRARRYVAGIANGLFYLIAGLFAGSLVMLFASLPKELVATLAGLALLGAVTTNLAGVVASDDHREASVIAFLSTASGMSFLGLGSAFWGIVIGMVAYCVLHKRWRPQAGGTAVIHYFNNQGEERCDKLMFTNWRTTRA